MENEKDSDKKFYQTNWFLWLFLIFFPPIGVVLLWTCHREKSIKFKIIVSVISLAWFLFTLVSAHYEPHIISSDIPETEQHLQAMTPKE